MIGLYEQTVLPEPFTILGRTLKPFSFGHYIILRRFNVGCVSDIEKKLTLEDLVFSIFICSLSWNEAKDLLYSGKWIEVVAEWSKEVAIDGTIDFEEKAILFNAYLDHHTGPSVIPKYKSNNSGDIQESNSEWYEDILATLTGKLGLDDDKVMNMCFSQAIYKYLSYAERQGSITFLNDRQIKAFAEKQFAKLPSELTPAEVTNG